MLRIGIDVGGTFTDLVAEDPQTGESLARKVPTTPHAPERGALRAVDDLLAAFARPPGISFLGHSTTIATNALLGQVGLELPRVAMVTTEGFRDVIEIGRQNRSSIYDLFVERPRPLVSRDDRFSVRERIDYRGRVLVPLDVSAVERVCRALAAREVVAVAICLLHSYANDEHERRIAEEVARTLPGATIARSSQVDPQYREYERFSTTVVNAALGPIVRGYVERLDQGLRDRGVAAPLYVMRSDGGLSSAAQTARLPAASIESGPASGVIAAAALGRRLGLERILSFDMGGTTAKAGTIVGGKAQIASEFEAAGKTHSGRAIKGSGYPVRFPFVDLAEVSAGGGTIAWLDDAGALRVGPLSAGAQPGPACYGSGEQATVTDANVVLGRINPTHLLGGAFAIDAARSRTAIAALSKSLGLSIHETAAGIVALVDGEMSKALRIVTIERGLDPRSFALAAFGGGGPLHACAIAEELHIERIFVPPDPGLFSARGLLVADLRETVGYPVLRDLATLGDRSLDEPFARAEAAAAASLAAQGALSEAFSLRRECDARYRGQSFEIVIAYHPSADRMRAHFHEAHRALYGYCVEDEIVEIVNARLVASAGVPATVDAMHLATAHRAPAPPARPASRRVWAAGRFAEAPVWQRDDLPAAARIDGPAVVEQYDATTFVAPGWALTVEPHALVLVRV